MDVVFNLPYRRAKFIYRAFVENKGSNRMSNWVKENQNSNDNSFRSDNRRKRNEQDNRKELARMHERSIQPNFRMQDESL